MVIVKYNMKNISFQKIRLSNLLSKIESSKDEVKAGQERLKVIVRTAIEAENGNGQPVLMKSLNECETTPDWKKALVSSAGITINTAQVYNTNNIAKWLCQISYFFEQ